MSEEHAMPYARLDSLEGLLQRGRGLGAVRALRDPQEAAGFVYDAAGASPYLRRFWLHTPHSYERTAYVKALSAIDRSGLEHVHTESLWDCEETARLTAIESAPAVPDTLERIAVLRDDPMETSEVRAAVRERLASAGVGDAGNGNGTHGR